MTILFEIFEESGPKVNDRGTSSAVFNMNWKKTANVATRYVYSPLRRPDLARDQTLSYKKFNYFRVSGSYTFIKNIKIELTVVGAGQVSDAQLFYKFSNVYEEPTNEFDGNMIKVPSNGIITWFPNVSAISPIAATEHPVCLNNTTFYTGYLVTQMRVNSGTTVGNTTGYQVKLSLQEFE